MVQYSGNRTGKITVIFGSCSEHETMMLGLVNIIRMGVNQHAERNEDNTHIHNVCDLLEAIIPDEFQLRDGIPIPEESVKQK